MKNFLLFAVLFISLNSVAQPALEKLWQTDSVLTTPESVLYDAKSKSLFVANIGDFSKPGTGSVSKVGLDGKIIKKDWVTGITAAKGMGLVNNMLYVAEMNTVAVIDVSKAAVQNRITIEGAEFLNDITTDANGGVYVSDSKTGKVHKIENGKSSVYLENLNGINGLLSVGSDLYILADGNLLKADASKKTTTLAKGMEGGTDGVAMVKDNEFVVSCWGGVIYYVNADGSTKVLSDTRAQSINSADLGYDAANRILYIPTFARNSVTAYKLK